MISPEDYVNLEVGSYISDKIEFPENISPQTYFAFAVSDIEGADDERSRVNSLSNAKRALHFQVDLIAKAYGFANPRNRANFHEKLEFCRNCGIVGPRILRVCFKTS